MMFSIESSIETSLDIICEWSLRSPAPSRSRPREALPSHRIRGGQVLRGVAAGRREGALQHDLLRAAFPAHAGGSRRGRLPHAGQRPAARDLHASGAAGADPVAQEWSCALHNTDVSTKCAGYSKRTPHGIAQGGNSIVHLNLSMRVIHVRAS